MENKKKDDTATLTALAHNVQPAYVRMIVRGVRKSNSEKAKDILKTYNDILEAKNNLSKPV
jgi:Rod binding domain-containing protein